MKNFLLYIFALAFFISCGHRSEHYKISGTTRGFQDGTILYLDNIFNQAMIDSAEIIAGKFSFTGQLAEPARIMLRTKDYSDNLIFWAENSEITITAQKGNFRNAKITGAKIEDRVAKFEKKLQPLLRGFSGLQDCKIRAADSLQREQLQKEKNSIQTLLDTRYMDYIYSHPDDIYSGYLLTCLLERLDKKKSRDLFNILSPGIKESPYGKYIYKYIRYSQAINIGDRAKNFGLRNPQEKIITLNQYRGDYLLLSFWTSGNSQTGSYSNCDGCLQMNQTLMDWYDKYHSKGLQVLSVSLDRNKADWVRGIQRDSLVWENVCDFQGFQGIVPIAYNVKSVPSIFLISSNGKIEATDPLKIEKILGNLYFN